MLLNLKIQNLILVQKANIPFGTGLNILTGETGAGKSAVLTAIRLIAGDRADADWIGKTSDLSVVEATVSSLVLPPEIAPLEEGKTALIRRELHRSGKSRCFINDHLVPLSALRGAIGSSIEIIDQSSSHALALPEEQRHLFDIFAQLAPQVEAFSASYSEALRIQKKREEIGKEQENRNRNLTWAREDLALIEEVDWKADEEESIAREHQILTHAQEIREKLESATEALEGYPLKKTASLLEHCLHLDPQLSSPAASIKSASLEVEEALLFLRSYLNKIDADPGRLDAVESRIAAIEQIKRRFGKTAEDVERKKKELLELIHRLAHLDEEQAELEASERALQKKNKNLADELTRKRKQAAPLFAEAVLKELVDLNLPRARFSVSIEEKPLSGSGADAIRFLFSANPGHSPLPIEECASGGELSRLLLAIKTVISEKESKSCLIFDEIDSNVGGQTASILGEKLQRIAQGSQVICITHFVQVAQTAQHHFLVSKREQNGLAVTEVVKLEEKKRDAEYQRMLGKRS